MKSGLTPSLLRCKAERQPTVVPGEVAGPAIGWESQLDMGETLLDTLWTYQTHQPA